MHSFDLDHLNWAALNGDDDNDGMGMGGDMSADESDMTNDESDW